MPFEASCEATRSRAGTPYKIHSYLESSQMYYVYLLRSLKNSSATYIGFTTDIHQRLETHNSGGSVYTKDFRPWKLVTCVAFDSQEKAKDFEKYIKVSSGNAFAKRRFW